MKVAIIGASIGQLPLCLKAKECGIKAICFAWPEGAICKDYVDKFYPISILEKDKIVEICKSEQVDGVVSNGSDLTAEITSYVATQLNLHGIRYEAFLHLKDKSIVRFLTSNIDELCQVHIYEYEEGLSVPFPCIVKPKIGASKKGVSFVKDEKELSIAIARAKTVSNDEIMIEEYIDGQEISVETISFEGQHYIIQITDKENSGAPHFVELSHHQPSQIDRSVRDKLNRIVPAMLDAVEFLNGAAHIEMKVGNNGDVYLIEINPRGGGDEISNKLVELSTGYDYVQSMINVSIGIFKEPVIDNVAYAGIYFLCAQRSGRLPFFISRDKQPWLVEKKYDITNGLKESTGNYDRNGYFIYKSDRKIVID